MSKPRCGTQKNYYDQMMASPVGDLKLVACDDGLGVIVWENDDPHRVQLNIVGRDANHPVLRETERQLHEYFVGRRQDFDLTLDFAGTDFQKKVWHGLLAIP